MSTKEVIIAAAPKSLTSEDKDLGWILGEWRSQNRNIDGIEWSEIVDFVSVGNRTRIKEYMRRDDFRENWLRHLMPQESKCKDFMRLVQAAENFCHQELEARKRKREKFEEHDNNSNPSPKRIAKLSNTKKITSVMQLVNRQLTLKSGPNELRPPRHLLLQSSVPRKAKKHESKQNTVPFSEAVSDKQPFQILETTKLQNCPNKKSSVPEQAKKHESKQNDAPFSEAVSDNQTFQITETTKLQNCPYKTTLEGSDPSQYQHLCPKSLGPDLMELAFLLEQARILKAYPFWNHVDAHKSASLAIIIRTKSNYVSFKKKRLEMLVGSLTNPRRRDFDTFRTILQEKLLESTSIKSKVDDANKPKIVVAKSSPSIEAKETIHTPTNSSSRIVALNIPKEKKQAKVKVHTTHRVARQRVSMTKKSSYALPSHWNIWKWEHLCPATLKPEEIELAFLLEQAYSLKARPSWKHVTNCMSDSLADKVRTKSHFSSFKDNKVIMLIGKSSSQRRMDFEAFREALRARSLANVPVRLAPKSKRETLMNPVLASDDKPEDEKSSISKESKESGSSSTALPLWDASQYEGLYADSLRPEQLELAFLFEQARSLKAASLWSHVHSYMSDALAKWIQSESRSPQFKNKRMRLLVGDLSEQTRQDFETFRSILREMPNALKYDRKGQPPVPSKPKKSQTGNALAKRKPLLEESSVPTFQALESELSYLCPGYLNPEEKELAFLLEQGFNLKVDRSIWAHVERFMSDTLANYFRSKCPLELCRRQGPRLLIGARNGERKRAFDIFRNNLRQSWFADNSARKNVVPAEQDCGGKTITLAVVTQGILVAKCTALVGEVKFNFDIEGTDRGPNLSLRSKRPRRTLDYRESNNKSKSMVIPSKVKKKLSSSAKLKLNTKRGSSIPIWVGPPDEDLGIKWPEGWIKKVFKRRNGATKGGTDNYWYSPISEKKLRSIAEVKRFMGYSRKCKGDEDAAWAKLKKASS
mmetsp:Transcript_19757/g.29954  ORF Transcript_19757/g.29954 Transcript_19757/m.29954 type:complete len:985 (-) Transcript_19757:266-3220(-)